MNDYMIEKIQEQPEIKHYVANWFHEKWDIPMNTYLVNIEECLNTDKIVPQWYIATIDNKIIGGVGVIENDFHNRKDLSPNICALYVEEDYRCQGIAGKMLDYVYEDMKNKGINTLYLTTNHTSFYEKYGWEYLCMVQEDDELEMIRMYIHQA